MTKVRGWRGEVAANAVCNADGGVVSGQRRGHRRQRLCAGGRRSARRAASVADMGYDDRTPPSRRAAGRRAWPAPCACTPSTEGGVVGSQLTWAQGAGKRLAIAGTGCGEHARLVRSSARRVGHQRGCLSVGLPIPPGRRRWKRVARDLRCGRLRFHALLCSYSVLAFLDILRAAALHWWGILPPRPA